MNFWRDNFIGNMYGPHFLLFYFVVIVVVLGVSRWWVRSADRSEEEQVADLPEPVEATDIALLRGSVNEVLRLTVVDLVHRGYLRVVDARLLGVTTSQMIAQASTPPDPRYLSPFQRAVFDFFKTPRKAAALFSDSLLNQWSRAQFSKAENRLEQYRLITPDNVIRKSQLIAALAVFIVVALGAYKLLVALSKGKTNVGFLIVMGILGTIFLLVLIKAPRISRRGRVYLQKLQARYSRLKYEIIGLTHPVDESGLIFAVALFGFSVLQGTAYANLVPVFRRAASSSGGGSGSSGCGGAGCGGGGCGGGGCGGGGCGGCGGGS